jgi:shikimate kinase
MNIVLIGYRGAGKSVVGRELASRLGMKFADLDIFIEERQHKQISEIVDSQGWDHFRNLEKQLIEDISKQDHWVIAPGGGAVLDANNIVALKEKSFIIWLKAEPEVLLKRIGGDPRTLYQRPSLTGRDSLEEIKEVLACRNPFYEKASMAQIDTTSLDIETVVGTILSILQERIKKA